MSAEENLKAAKRSRGGHRAYVTKIVKESEALLQDKAAPLRQSELKTNAAMLKQKLEELRKWDEKVAGLIDDDDAFNDEFVEAGDYNRGIVKVLVGIEEELQGDVKPAVVKQKNETSKTSSQKSTKLPRLEVPAFDGDPLRFWTFWDTFECMIDKDDSLDEQVKFTYLKSKMEGKAKLALEGLTLTKANYKEAVKLLHERFGDEQTIIQSHMDALLALLPVEEHQIEELRKLCDVIEVHIRNLQSFKISVQNYGPVLISIIVSKLPREVNLEVSCQMPAKGKWEIDQLMEAVKKEVAARERCAVRDKCGDGWNRTPQSSSTIHLQTRDSGSGPRNNKKKKGKGPSCIFCGKGGHQSSECRTIKSIEARKSIIQKERRCFICLIPNHTADKCNKRSVLSCNKCKGKHHEAICDKNTSEAAITRTQKGEEDGVDDARTLTLVNPSSYDSSRDSSNNCVLLQTARAEVMDEKKKKVLEARIIFDNCSQRSFITENLRHKLGLPTVRKAFLNLKPFGIKDDNIQKKDIACVTVRNRRHRHVTQKIECFVVPLICSRVTGQCIDLVKEHYPQLQSIELADDNCNSTSLEVDILVGANFINFIVASKQIIVEGGLTATSTLLGWVLNGEVKNKIMPQDQLVNLATASHVLRVDTDILESESSVKAELRKFWEMEEPGDLNEDVGFDHAAFKEKISFKDGRYSVPLPFLDGTREVLPLNNRLAERRLESMTRKLKTDPEKFKRYDEVIKLQEEEGKIERVYDFPPQGLAHVLPHQSVVKEDRETTKFRVVYDASSGNPSLNASLDKGENLVPPMIDVLTRSRTFKIALLSDIKQAFLSVAVDEEYRDFLRFLWYDDITAPDPEIVTYRFTRVLFGVNASLWLLDIVIQKHLELYKKTDCLYVDDHIGGAHDTDTAFEIYKKLKEMFLAGGFELRKWCSSDFDLQQKINECELLGIKSSENFEVKEKTKILGVPLDLTSDEFYIRTYDVYCATKNITISKRGVLHITNSIFDPAGFIALIVISFKVFFQHVVQLKCKWDVELPPDFQIKWIKLIELLHDDSLFRIKRYYFGAYSLKDFKEFHIHGFCDASDVAYAAVVYIVGVTEEGKRVSCFVRARTRVAPIKKVSTPRLELCACVMLANLVADVIESFNKGVIQFSSTTCWNDSLDALFWIKNNKKQRKVFVENRVIKARKKVAASNWRHLPSELNPADVASRGITRKQQTVTEFPKIMAGPAVLRQDYHDWPEDLSKDVNTEPTEDVIANCTFEPEVQVVCLHLRDEITMKPVQKIKVNPKCVQVDNIIRAENYSCLWKLLRITAWVKRFVHNSRRKNSNVTPHKGYLTIKEVDDAERTWIISMQRNLESKTKQLNNTLGLYLDNNGVLLCKGRLNNSKLTTHQKNPILIPGNCYFARLLVVDAHLRTDHGGNKDTRVQLRSRFWVTKARNLVRQAIHGCSHPCQRLEGKPFKSAESSQLPNYRVCQSIPFTNTGVDYTGPLLVRQVYDSKSKEMYKTWIVLYTCAVTRAVHLDLVPDTSASAFLRSLDRFMYRRVVPNLMISDNATCFKNEEVKLNEELLRLRVKWQFIVPASPWWGGFWERLIQTVKRSLRKVLFRSSVNYEELLTIITRIEGIINSRPLTYDNEAEEPLTPSHLLTGHRLLSTFEKDSFDNGSDVNQMVLTKRMKYLKDLSHHYWKRFRDEYLIELRSQHVQGSNPTRVPEIGEVVVIGGTKKSNDWRLGKIIALIQSPDGRNRAATIKTFDGTKSRYIRRPIERLYPIEVKSSVPVSKEEIVESFEASEEPSYKEPLEEPLYTERSERPSRVAAEKGILTRRLAGQV